MKPFQRAFPARPESVAAARLAVREFAGRVGLPDETAHDLTLAVSEACTNAVVHGYVGQKPGRFVIRAIVDSDAVEVTVRDEGRGMRPRTDSPGLGLGLPLIARVADAFEVHQPAAGYGTELRMTFRMRAAA